VSESPQVLSDEPRDPVLSQLYQATRQPQPAAELDAAIRAQARRQCRRRPARRWFVPLGAAAVLLLGVSLSLRVLDWQPRIPAGEVVESRADSAARPAARLEAPADLAAPQMPAPKRLERKSHQAPGPASESVLESTWAPQIHTQREAGAPAGLSGALPAPSPAPAESWSATPAQPSAAARLATIRSLLANGEIATARLELTNFRLYFPREPVPADVLEALAKAEADGI
jgi:hypothetical protein